MKNLLDRILPSPGLDQLPLDPLPELLPSCFLPFELSSSSDLEADESKLCVDMD